jgi:hypothetical protein
VPSSEAVAERDTPDRLRISALVADGVVVVPPLTRLSSSGAPLSGEAAAEASPTLVAGDAGCGDASNNWRDGDNAGSTASCRIGKPTPPVAALIALRYEMAPPQRVAAISDARLGGGPGGTALAFNGP